LVTAVGQPGEQARISDFGLAVTRDDDARLTRSGVVCTPAYAAPEQLLGKDIDHRVDLYALGSTLFEMLSGGVPVFGGDAQEVTSRKLAGEARSLAVVAPYTPPNLIRLINRLLDPDPAKRPPSALAVLARLDNAGTEPTVATQVPARRRRHHWFAMGCVSVAALAVVGAAPAARTGSAAAGLSLRDEQVALAAPMHASAREQFPASTHEQVPAAARIVPAVHAPLAASSRAAVGEPAMLAQPLVQRAAPVLALTAPARAVHTAPRELRVVSLDVEGSLPRSVVARAVARSLPALQSCRVTDAVAHFTIDDSRRAADVQTRSPCIAQALAHLRTEVAPDMGDAAVVLTLASR
jgi:hypothetical protein